jgi:hypothetical protein
MVRGLLPALPWLAAAALVTAGWIDGLRTWGAPDDGNYQTFFDVRR